MIEVTRTQKFDFKLAISLYGSYVNLFNAGFSNQVLTAYANNEIDLNDRDQKAIRAKLGLWQDSEWNAKIQECKTK